jgi:hypothetical protein
MRSKHAVAHLFALRAVTAKARERIGQAVTVRAGGFHINTLRREV